MYKDISAELGTIRALARTLDRDIVKLEKAIARFTPECMWPAECTEQWQARNGQGNKYLYMLFRKVRHSTEYEGPNGARKVYVGSDPDKVESARAKVRNYARWALLLSKHGRLCRQRQAILQRLRQLLSYYRETEEIDKDLLKPEKV